ncbi:hypothetical protein GCM10023149_01080 [Mucilaginibacter gynuensis]|uniref:LTXXQ motif family protein n=1 Tax=Mucilaginibacter gynuensis TaxID=1302236 RepID=A0ABP8FN60_9SPHI
MKKLLLIIAFVGGLGTLANAQTKVEKTPGQKAQHLTAKLQKELKLNVTQAKQVNAILLTQVTKVDSVKANKTQGDKKQHKAARKEILANTDQQISAILTADQKKAYIALKAAQKEKHKGHKEAAEKE